MKRELFHWTYEPSGPLFVKLETLDDGEVKLGIYIKFRDTHDNHNHFLDVKSGAIDERVDLIENGFCPNCKQKMWFHRDDKYNATFCRSCDYTAWSDKIYFESVYQHYDDYY